MARLPQLLLFCLAITGVHMKKEVPETPGDTIDNVNIHDVMDTDTGFPLWTNEPPIWINSLDILHKYGLPENTPEGSLVGTLRAWDPEMDTLTYSTDSVFFNVDTTTGDVFLMKQLDREAQSSITVNFIARDSHQHEIEVTQEVLVKDINDNAPVFMEQEEDGGYAVQVHQRIQDRTVVFSGVKVMDADEGRNSNVELSCYHHENITGSTEACEVFEIAYKGWTGDGHQQGIIYLKGELTEDMYQMWIKAEDRGRPRLSSMVMVTMVVYAPDHVLPRLINSTTISITENLNIGESVGQLIAQDHSDSPSPLVISITDSIDAGQFFLTLGETVQEGDVYRVDLLVNGTVDRELLPTADQELTPTHHDFFFIVKVVKADGGPSVEFFMPILVADEDDEIPRFSPDAVIVTIPEDLAHNEAIADLGITVNDADKPPYNSYSLRLEGEGSSNFRLNPTFVAGKAPLSLTVIDPQLLDQEADKQSLYHFTVVGQVQDGERMSMASLEIHVADVNDNSPHFRRDKYEVHAQDSMKSGEILAQIKAFDADEDGNAILAYTLTGEGTDRFAVNPHDGTLTVAADLRGADSKYHLTLSATDVGGNVWHTSVVIIVSFGTPKTSGVEITLVDNGASSPFFQGASLYETFVDEGSVILNPSIRIVPSDPSTSFTYSITSGNFLDAFMISPSGYLVLTRPLDRSETPDNLGYYTLTIQATTSGIPALSSTITIKVRVQDINNHPPVFEHSKYMATLNELTPPGSSVLNVRASDADYGENATISYSIISGSRDAFVINSATGLVQVASPVDLTIEPMYGNMYNMVVYAVDHGTPPLTGSTTVEVTITDVNNQFPVFTQELYIRAFSQDTEEGALVAVVAARDSDTNANIRYSIKSESFDVRDSEGGQINAQYPVNYANAFRVDAVTGELTTTMALSAEDVSEMSFMVMANDTNAQIPALLQTVTALVKIIFLPESALGLYFNEPWTFEMPYISFSLSETAAAGTELIPSVIAMDTNLQPATSYIKVAGTDPMGYFSDVTTDAGVGRIYLNEQVDYDTMGDNKQLTFQVMATLVPRSDETTSKTAYATIAVDILDVNDNKPSFYQQEYVYSVPENARYPTVLGTITATDPDSGDYGTISYSLTGTGHESFTINPTTGELSVAEGAVLDAEVMPVYSLYVKARDNPSGTTSKEVWAELTIYVEDVNDNAPMFTSITYNALMMDNTPSGTYILTVSATDADARNEALTYAITTGNQQNLFMLVPSNGSLWTRRSLIGYASSDPYELSVSVMDDAGMSAEAGIKIYIYDSTFSGTSAIRFIDPPSDNLVIQVNEEFPVGTPVINVFANDPTNPGQVEYQLQSTADSNKFNIDRQTGLITNSALLDAEQQTTYTLTVVASFVNNPSQTAELTITVNVDDLDDHEPNFYECEQPLFDNPVHAYAKENQPSGQAITTVTACDADQPPYNDVYYAIVCGNDPTYSTGGVRPFSISQDGVLTGEITFDRETQYSYKLCVKATSDSNYLPPSSSMDYDAVQNDPSILRILVTIQDEDDTPPSFGMPNATFYASVMAEAPFHSRIIQITSYDPDRNSVLVYSLSQMRFHGFDDSVTSMVGAFTIDQQTGMIYTNLVHYLPYTDGYFSMNVLVSSSPSQAQTSSSLIIYVVRSSQMLKLVFDREPEYLVDNQNSITNKLGNILGVVMQVDGIRYHALENGIIEYSQSDLCFHMIKDTKIVEPAVAYDMFDNDRYQPELGDAFQEFSITGDVGKCTVKFTTIWWSGYWYLWWLLIALALLIFILAVIIMICLCCCYFDAKKKLPKVKPYTMLDPYVIPYEYEEATIRM